MSPYAIYGMIDQLPNQIALHFLRFFIEVGVHAYDDPISSELWYDTSGTRSIATI